MSNSVSPRTRVLILDEPDQTGMLAAFFTRFEHGRTYEVETASVIVTTDRRQARGVEEVLAKGVFAYVPKPCEFMSFEHIVALAPPARVHAAKPRSPARFARTI